MSDRIAELRARKQLLLARSRLHRLQLRHETAVLRRSLATPRGLASIALSAPVRPLLFSALLMIAGRGRLSRVVKGAMAGLPSAQAVRAAMAAKRNPPG